MSDEMKEAAKTEEKAMSEETKTEPKKVDSKKENEEISKLQNELAEMTKKFETAEKNFEAADKNAEDWKNKYYEAYADMSNVRKQIQKESDDFKKYAVEKFVKDIIPALDSFDYALKKEQSDPALQKYLEGFLMINNKFLDAFKAHDIQVIQAQKGEEYDPNLMEAFSSIDGEEDNKVVDVFLKGYKLHDHLLRPCGVIISKKAEVQPTEDKKDTVESDKKDEK